MSNLQDIKELWQSSWDEAVALWNPYVTLREPTWCFTTEESHNEGLTGSFAMIRLKDHKIVINLKEVKEYGVETCALQILAHEIGHHVLVPANRYDNVNLLNRMRIALAGIEDRAPFVANLYADIIINDNLQRSKKLDMVEVYRKINEKSKGSSPVFDWMMRTFEYLWGLKRNTLCKTTTPQIDADASLAASVVRSYSREWLRGAGRYALLAYPYLIEDKEAENARKALSVYLDSESCGEGSEITGGMTAIDESILGDIVDPRSEALGVGSGDTEESEKKADDALPGRNELGGQGPQERYFGPGVYIDMMKQANPAADENALIARYYREIALPYLVPFPVEENEPLTELLPEGTDSWEPGDSIEEIDWFETTTASPVVIPGFTTKRRIYAPDEDIANEPTPYNLYVGIDCSGSMRNPKHNFSWPVLAGTIVTLSALRAGAHVMSCLSGEPGSYLETEGFIRNEQRVLSVLTSYLGTGYAYGIPRLETPALDEIKGKTHLMIVSDDDIFHMLQSEAPSGGLNFDIAEKALERAGGGGTFVLHSRPQWKRDDVECLLKMGWNIHYVTDEQEMVQFAHAFAQKFYDRRTKR